MAILFIGDLRYDTKTNCYCKQIDDSDVMYLVWQINQEISVLIAIKICQCGRYWCDLHHCKHGITFSKPLYTCMNSKQQSTATDTHVQLCPLFYHYFSTRTLTNPQSTTYTMPGIVTEVSAIFVAIIARRMPAGASWKTCKEKQAEQTQEENTEMWLGDENSDLVTFPSTLADNPCR